MPQKTIMSFLGRYLLCGALEMPIFASGCRELCIIIIKTKYG